METVTVEERKLRRNQRNRERYIESMKSPTYREKAASVSKRYYKENMAYRHQRQQQSLLYYNRLFK